MVFLASTCVKCCDYGPIDALPALNWQHSKLFVMPPFSQAFFSLSSLYPYMLPTLHSTVSQQAPHSPNNQKKHLGAISAAIQNSSNYSTSWTQSKCSTSFQNLVLCRAVYFLCQYVVFIIICVPIVFSVI